MPGALHPSHWAVCRRVGCVGRVYAGEPCSSTPTPALPMPTPADELAQLLAAVLAYRPQPRAWPRPRPPRLRGVVRVRSTF